MTRPPLQHASSNRSTAAIRPRSAGLRPAASATATGPRGSTVAGSITRSSSKPPMRSRPRRFVVALAAVLAAPFALCAVAPAADTHTKASPAPFKARYQVTYRGISGGQLENAVRPGAVPGQWLYESRAFPNILGRVAVSPDARQRSTMEVAQGAVRPLSLVFDD